MEKEIFPRGLEFVPETQNSQKEKEPLESLVVPGDPNGPGNGGNDIEFERERIKQFELKPIIYIFCDRNKPGISFIDMRDSSSSVSDTDEDKYVTTLESISIVGWNDKINAQEDKTSRVSRTIDDSKVVYEAFTYIVTEEELEMIAKKILQSDDPQKIEIIIPKRKYNYYDDFLKIKNDISNVINMGYDFDYNNDNNSKVATGNNQIPNESFNEPINNSNHNEDIIDSFSYYNKFDPTDSGGFDNYDPNKGIK